MKLTLALVGLLAIARCPGTLEAPPPPDVEEDDEEHNDCWGLTSSLPICEPGVEQIDPKFDPRLGFDKRYYDEPQVAVVDSVSGETMVLEGPWNMPYTFTWFESLEGLFVVGDEVELSGREWNVVAGPRGTVAHADIYGFTMESPGEIGADRPDVQFFADCVSSGSTFVYGVAATMGEERVTVAQGERGSIAGWEILHHGAASAPGYEEDCMIVEGYFHGAISAWTTNRPSP